MKLSPWHIAETDTLFKEHGGIMRVLVRVLVALNLTVIACQGRRPADNGDTARAQQSAESSAAAPRVRESRPADSTAGLAAGKEPGTTPATPTPTVTSENSIAAMRLQLQRLDTASVENLQRNMKEHSTKLGDLLTTMRVEVQAVTSPAKDAWVASADTVERDLGQLALVQGEELRTAYRVHRSRVLRLLDGFRVLVPAKPM